MDNSTTIVLSRMMRASRAMDVIANNIANASTPGYKSLHLSSSTWIDRMRNVDAPEGGDTLTYAKPTGTWRSTSPGPIHQTGNPLDLALSGAGYFNIQTSAGTRLTRDGHFTLSSDGSVITSSGDKVLDTSGQPILVPPDAQNLSIASDGTISSKTGSMGHIAVVTVDDPQSLVAEGGNLLRTSTATSPLLSPGIVQGALEGSNVQPIKEISDMLQASQNFQMISQFLTAEHTRDENAVSKIISQN